MSPIRSELPNNICLPCLYRLVFPWRVFYLSATSAAEAKDWIDLIQWKLVSLFDLCCVECTIGLH